MTSFFNSFISSSCVLCDADVRREISLCDACQSDLPIIIRGCEICGIPLAHEAKVCGKCLKTPPTFDYSVSVYHYANPVDYLISELKFDRKIIYASILGFLLKESLLQNNIQEMPEVILPVPLHQKRLAKRGFNQSLEIAKIVSKEFNIPIDYRFVRRKKSTQAQSELDLKQRKRNIKGCFELESMSTYQHVVIIDDVVTTGATTNELAIILKKAGVKTVGVWSVARAVLNSLS